MGHESDFHFDKKRTFLTRKPTFVRESELRRYNFGYYPVDDTTDLVRLMENNQKLEFMFAMDAAGNMYLGVENPFKHMDLINKEVISKILDELIDELIDKFRRNFTDEFANYKNNDIKEMIRYLVMNWGNSAKNTFALLKSKIDPNKDPDKMALANLLFKYNPDIKNLFLGHPTLMPDQVNEVALAGTMNYDMENDIWILTNSSGRYGPTFPKGYNATNLTSFNYLNLELLITAQRKLEEHHLKNVNVTLFDKTHKMKQTISDENKSKSISEIAQINLLTSLYYNHNEDIVLTAKAIFTLIKNEPTHSHINALITTALHAINTMSDLDNFMKTPTFKEIKKIAPIEIQFIETLRKVPLNLDKTIPPLKKTR